MKAVIRDGGHQYQVSEGTVLDVEFRPLEKGSSLEFAEVLFLGGEGMETRIGTPTVAGAKVLAKVLGPQKGDKLIAAKFRRRKGSKSRKGHRQNYLRVKIEKIES